MSICGEAKSLYHADNDSKSKSLCTSLWWRLYVAYFNTYFTLSLSFSISIFSWHIATQNKRLHFPAFLAVRGSRLDSVHWNVSGRTAWDFKNFHKRNYLPLFLTPFFSSQGCIGCCTVHDKDITRRIWQKRMIAV